MHRARTTERTTDYATAHLPLAITAESDALPGSPGVALLRSIESTRSIERVDSRENTPSSLPETTSPLHFTRPLHLLFRCLPLLFRYLSPPSATYLLPLLIPLPLLLPPPSALSILLLLFSFQGKKERRRIERGGGKGEARNK